MKVAADENTIILNGTVGSEVVFDHQLYGEDFFVTTLMVPRLSGTVDCLPATLPSRILSVIPQVGDRICIVGQIRTYNRCNQGVNRLCVTVFAKELYPAEDELPENRAVLTGYLCKPVIYRTTPFMREIGDMLIASTAHSTKAIIFHALHGAEMPTRQARYPLEAECARKAGSKAETTKSFCQTEPFRTELRMRSPALL